MKTLCQMLWLLLLPASISAQSLPTSSDTSPVAVIQMKWHYKLFNPALEEDPMRASSEHRQAEIDRRDAMRINGTRARMGLPPEMPRARVRAPERDDAKPSTIYLYEAKVRNDGEKAIRALVWDYVFFEPGTQQEVGRRRFISRVSVRPGKITSLVARTTIPPTGAIDATKVDKKAHEQYLERVVIESIEYADGSIWQTTAN
jgi:hypothetical protein